MHRKPTLSPSKISTYLACPDKYKWTYVDDRGKWYLKARSYFSFGSTLHRVLQRFHDSGDTGVTTTSEALAALEENWIDAGYSSAQEMQEALGEGREIISAHVDRALAVPTTAQTIMIEQLLRLDLGEFTLIGRVDRVDEWEDGTLEVVDYKSGRSTVSEEEVASDLAMCCYQLLLRGKFPERKVIASILAIRSGDKASASLTDAEAEEFRSDLTVLGREILGRDYEHLEPVWKELCADCDFLTLCRKHPAFEEPNLASAESLF